MLITNSSNKLTFDVNIQGTAALPTVRCMVGEYPSLSFDATRLPTGEYEVIIDLPANFRVGPQPFKVEVLLNGRLFTPINKSIDVSAGDLAEESIPVPAPKPVPSPEPIKEPIKEPTPQPPPVSAAKKESLLSALENSVTAKKDKHTAVPSVAVQESIKKKPALVIPAQQKPVAPIKFTMADIANESYTPAPAVKRPVKSAEHTKNIPVTLIKGEIIYR